MSTKTFWRRMKSCNISLWKDHYWSNGFFLILYKKILSPEIFNKRTKKKQGVFFAQSSEWDWRIKCWHNVVCTARDAGERNRKIRPNSNQKRRWRRSPITSTIRLEVAIRKAHQPSNNRVVLIWGRPLRHSSLPPAICYCTCQRSYCSAFR